jgi:hypothetical protein
VTAEELADLRAHAGEIDLDAALAIEREIGHDLMAEIRVYASQATISAQPRWTSRTRSRSFACGARW